jgi:CRP/FNR family cyclic AMP-dependent transcriptional regulator
MNNGFAQPQTSNHATLRPLRTQPLAPSGSTSFNPQIFLTQGGEGRTILQCQKQQILFAEGDKANEVFYIQDGLVKLTVLSTQGKEAVITILEGGDFFGETCLTGQRTYPSTATSLGASTIVRIDHHAMSRALRNEPAFSEMFMAHLLTRNLRLQEDLIDHHFNTAERRLARRLLLLAHFGSDKKQKPVIPPISQETLAEMIGTTRSRVSFFLNRFKKLGFIEYQNNAGLHVHDSLRNVVHAS